MLSLQIKFKRKRSNYHYRYSIYCYDWLGSWFSQQYFPHKQQDPRFLESMQTSKEKQTDRTRSSLVSQLRIFGEFWTSERPSLREMGKGRGRGREGGRERYINPRRMTVEIFLTFTWHVPKHVCLCLVYTDTQRHTYRGRGRERKGGA